MSWLADMVGIRGLHYRLEKARGKAWHELCVACGRWADEWSYIGVT